MLQQSPWINFAKGLMVIKDSSAVYHMDRRFGRDPHEDTVGQPGIDSHSET